MLAGVFVCGTYADVGRQRLIRSDAEVTDEEISVFVRDRGAGFDRSTVPPDRRGLAESIEGRLERAGGRATVTSAPGEGTEVELQLPRSAP